MLMIKRGEMAMNSWYEITQQGLPVGISKHDMFFGTITGTNRSGAYIRLHSQNMREIPTAFAFCCGSVGDEVLVSVRRMDHKRETLLVDIDSFLRYAEPQIQFCEELAA